MSAAAGAGPLARQDEVIHTNERHSACIGIDWRNMRWIAASALAMLSTTAVEARSLVMVSNITNGPKVYGSVLIDTDSIAAHESQRSFWSYVFTRDGDDDVRGVNYTEVNCGSGKIRYLKRQIFSASHSMIDETDRPTSWSKARGESAEIRMVRLACGTEKSTEAEILGDLNPLDISDALLNDPKFR